MGIPKLTLECKVSSCCIAGRQHRERFRKISETHASIPGQCVHIDLMGPMQKASLKGSLYICPCLHRRFFKKKLGALTAMQKWDLQWISRVQTKDQTRNRDQNSDSKVRLRRRVPFDRVQIVLHNTWHWSGAHTSKFVPTKWSLEVKESNNHGKSKQHVVRLQPANIPVVKSCIARKLHDKSEFN